MSATVPPATGGQAPTETRSSEVLRIVGLGVGTGVRAALDSVDLALAPGELVGLTGEPGAGKTTLVRCLAGDIIPARGQIRIGGRVLVPGRPASEGEGIAVVWQDLALCDNLDVAANLLLGRESRRLLLSEMRFHAAAAEALRELRIPIHDTTQLAGSLSVPQRQMLAVARAAIRRPRLLVMDEPIASLGVNEAEMVERIIAELRAQGTAVLLATRDVSQMRRLADRILVLRHGRVVAELDPADTHPDELAALLSGQPVDSTARRQLTRLHGLAGRLVSAEPSSSLSLILSALAAALDTHRACIHVVKGDSLVCEASLGFAEQEIAALAELPLEQAQQASRSSGWSVPVTGSEGVVGMISVFRDRKGEPQRDQLDLLSLYAGYAAGAIERDRLLDQLTARNRVLETTREVLEALTGPVPFADGLATALASLRNGLGASEVGLLAAAGGAPEWRALVGPARTSAIATPAVQVAAEQALRTRPRDGTAREVGRSGGPRVVAAPFDAPAGAAVLIAVWGEPETAPEETALIENAVHSLRLALEREEAALAHQEAAALRRSRKLQRDFLSRLSHELRTPLTAIRGYASSLMQPDVSWDDDSQQRFLGRIGAESSRLGRLVDDLLDFSAIESGVMRLQHDWCDIALVVEAAVACLPDERRDRIEVSCQRELPAVWADHDRLEQVFVNLLVNAYRHNRPETRIRVNAAVARESDAATPPARVTMIEVTVSDDGRGLPADLRRSPFEPTRRPRSASSGAGLGLSIAKGIVEAHGGEIELLPVPVGSAFRIRLPVEATGVADSPAPAEPEPQLA